jgi:putative transposase
VVFIPKGRKKELYGNIRKFLGGVFHELANQAVSTVGFEADKIRAYIRHQEQLDSQGSDETGNF